MPGNKRKMEAMGMIPMRRIHGLLFLNGCLADAGQISAVGESVVTIRRDASDAESSPGLPGEGGKLRNGKEGKNIA